MKLKVCGGPVVGGYRTSDQTNYAFIKTSYAMAKDLLSTEIGNEMFTKFVVQRMKAHEKKRTDFFPSIPKSKSKLKVKVKNNTLDVIKENRQAFGLWVGKVKTPSEALKYPVTAVPWALTEPDQALRQQSNATLRRRLYEKSDLIVRRLQMEQTS